MWVFPFIFYMPPPSNEMVQFMNVGTILYLLCNSSNRLIRRWHRNKRHSHASISLVFFFFLMKCIYLIGCYYYSHSLNMKRIIYEITNSTFIKPIKMYSTLKTSHQNKQDSITFFSLLNNKLIIDNWIKIEKEILKDIDWVHNLQLHNFLNSKMS